MYGALAEQAIYVRQSSGLSESQIGDIVGAAKSTLGAWINSRRQPTGIRADRLLELVATVRQLEPVMKPEYISVWLMSPVPRAPEVGQQFMRPPVGD